MRYMMLIHHDEPALAAAPPQMYAEYAAFNEALAKAGGESGPGIRLEPASKATTVRVTGDKTDVLDGPYADTKEQFAGYFFVEADSIEDAVAWAKRCPSSRYGSIEIRPVWTPPAGGGWK